MKGGSRGIIRWGVLCITTRICLRICADLGDSDVEELISKFCTLAGTQDNPCIRDGQPQYGDEFHEVHIRDSMGRVNRDGGMGGRLYPRD